MSTNNIFLLQLIAWITTAKILQYHIREGQNVIIQCTVWNYKMHVFYNNIIIDRLSREFNIFFYKLMTATIDRCWSCVEGHVIALYYNMTSEISHSTGFNITFYVSSYIQLSLMRTAASVLEIENDTIKYARC